MPSRYVTVADNNAQTFSLSLKQEKISQPRLNGQNTLDSQFVPLYTNYYTIVSAVVVITLIPRSVFSAYSSKRFQIYSKAEERET